MRTKRRLLLRQHLQNQQFHLHLPQAPLAPQVPMAEKNLRVLDQLQPQENDTILKVSQNRDETSTLF